MIDIVGATTGRLFGWTVIQKILFVGATIGRPFEVNSTSDIKNGIIIVRRSDLWSPFCMVAKKIKQPPLRHCVTPLLKERLIGSHRGELSTQLTEGWLLNILFYIHIIDKNN